MVRKVLQVGLLGWMIIGFVACVGQGLQSANLKLDQGKYDEAIGLYQEHLSNKPQDIEARNRLGFAYLKTGKIDASMAEFGTVLNREPGNSYATLYLGLGHLNKAQYGDAIALWQGFRDPKQPLVEAEIKRQLTLLQIAESQRMAEKALAQEDLLSKQKPQPNTIAVCYYKDLSPGKSLTAFQKGLAAMITTDLAKVGSLKVIERLRLQALLEEMQLGQMGIVDERSAPRVGRLLGAQNMVVGSISEGSIQVATTVNKQSSAVRVATEDFWQIPPMVITTVAKALGIELTPEEEAAVGTPHTKVLEAFTYYGEALIAQDAGRWEEAKDLFAKALQADPDFQLAGEGSESCPGASAPSIETLSTMTATQMFDTVANTVSAAQEAQQESSTQEETMTAPAPAASDTEGSGGGGGS